MRPNPPEHEPKPEETPEYLGEGTLDPGAREFPSEEDEPGPATRARSPWLPLSIALLAVLLLIAALMFGT